MNIRDVIRGRGRGIGKTGRRAEKRSARRGQLVPGSGSGRWAVAGRVGLKGDYRLGNFLFEVKSTVRDSISVRLSWLEKITEEAHSSDREPALEILFTTGDGRPRPRGEWVAIPRAVFDELVGT